jgi:hypothetical protein
LRASLAGKMNLRRRKRRKRIEKCVLFTQSFEIKSDVQLEVNVAVPPLLSS